jgi:hypothetical protein
MIHRGPFPVKKACLWFIVAILCTGISFIIYLSLISINIGFRNMDRDGFFIPVLAGILSLILCVILLILVFKSILTSIKEKDLFTSRL